MEKEFQELTNNLESMIHESMAKIGYVKGQPVGIYYTEDLIHHLLGIDIKYKERSEKETVSQALKLLEGFVQENEAEWGTILVEHQKGRYKLTVPAKGMAYVYENNKDNHFLENLIDCLKDPDANINMIVEIFKKYSDRVNVEKSHDDEFEYAVSFEDDSIDPFIYCFTFDEMGKYYHRFTKYDYQKLVHDN